MGSRARGWSTGTGGLCSCLGPTHPTLPHAPQLAAPPTALPTHRPKSEPWRVQFFQCGYSAVSGWRGWRAVVMPLKQLKGSSGASSDERRWWVDMPYGGPPSHLLDHAAKGEGG